jgi:hypothetical protein
LKSAESLAPSKVQTPGTESYVGFTALHRWDKPIDYLTDTYEAMLALEDHPDVIPDLQVRPEVGGDNPEHKEVRLLPSRKEAEARIPFEAS